jgi:hypothetical protein
VAQRLIPQPRHYRPVTDADPIATRITLIRSNDGNRIGMFIQVFADGTVINSEGVHHLGREGIRPLVDVLQAGELYRLKGYCGSPPTDYLEHVHVVVYERSLGRLRANAFSFSGNPEGCDPAVRKLQSVFEAIESKLSRPASTSTAAPTAVSGLTGAPALVAPSTHSTASVPLSAPIQLNGPAAQPGR